MSKEITLVHTCMKCAVAIHILGETDTNMVIETLFGAVKVRHILILG